MKAFGKALSIFLSILMIISVIPLQSFAMEIDHNVDSEAEETVEKVKEEPKILYETEEKRNEHTKVYKKSDGTYTAMVSLAPIHYKENGKWKDIDNSLKKNGNKKLENICNKFKVSFPEKINEGEAVSVFENGYELSFSLNGIEESKAKAHEKASKKSKKKALADEALKNLSSTVTYKNIFPHTDLEYTLKTTSVKENIIIKKASAAMDSYTFTVKATGLYGEADENGAVTFKNDDGEEIFKIPAPVMLDADNIISNDIKVDFSKNEDGSYSLTYTPSKEWLNDENRAYPVKLDPEIEDFLSLADYKTFVSSAFPEENFYDVQNEIDINPDNHTDFGITETYIIPYFDGMFDLSPDVALTNVTLSMRGQVNGIIGIYPIYDIWDPTSVTYEYKPYYGEQYIDYYYGEPHFYDEGSWVNFDITNWWQPYIINGNWGIAIKPIEDNPEWYAIFNHLPLNDQDEIYMYFEYADPETGNSEIASNTDVSNHQVQSAGRAGTASMSEFTKEIAVFRDDISISGNIMPVTASFTYNKWIKKNYQYYNSYKKALINLSECTKPYGNDWLSSYNEMFFVNSESTENPQYMYHTGDGRNIPLKVTKENGKWIVEQDYMDIYGDCGYTFTVDIPENDSRDFCDVFNCITVRTPDGFLQKYDTYGRLVKIYKEKYPSQAITIEYLNTVLTANNVFAISYIQDGSGRKYKFAYTGGLLSSIQCYNSSGTAIKAGSTSNPLKMTYGYSNNDLTSVTFPDGKAVTYTYSYSGLYTMQNIDKYTLTLSSGISENTYDSKDKKVNGNSISIYKFDSTHCRITDAEGMTLIKEFDQYGRTVSVTDDKGNCTYYDYTDSTDGQPTAASYKSANGNMLKNSSFESDFENWQTRGLSGSDITENFALTGKKSLKIEGNKDTSKTVTQTVNDITAGIYTLSAYVKSCGTGENNKLTVTAEALSSTGSVLRKETREIYECDEDFSQYSLTFEAPSGSKSLRVSIGTLNSDGLFYVDNVQLEKGSYASSCNYALNGSFNDGLNNWSYSGIKPSLFDYNYYNYPYSSKKLKAASLCTGPFNTLCLSNEAVVNGKKGDDITVSALMCADDLVLSSPDYIFDLSHDIDRRYAELTAEYTYTDENGTEHTESETYTPKEHLNTGKYIQFAFTLKGDCNKIKVTLNSRSIIDPSFGVADVSVTKTERLRADDFEDVEEIPTPEEPETEEPEIPEETDDAETPEKKFDIQFDEFGNLTFLKILGMDLGALLPMITSRSYDSLGNYLTSMTNENGETVKYNYNRDNGVLNSVTDEIGNLTEYTYDAVNALTKIKTPVSALTNLLSDDMITSYKYTNDRVSSITHNDFTYNIEYDQWGNVKTIFVGAIDTLITIPFVEYTYGTGKYRSQVKSVSFKNGDKIDYRYNNDLLTGISYDGGKTYCYEYSYDELGYLTKIVDNNSGRTVYYNLDSVEIYDDGSLLYKAYIDSNGDFAEKINGRVYVTKQYESDDGSKSGIISGSQALTLSAKTDNFGRTAENTLIPRNPENAVGENEKFSMLVTDYKYKSYTKNGEKYAGSRIDTLTNTVKHLPLADGVADTQYSYAYEYDAKGNITHEYEVSASGAKTLRHRYTYDEANQLVRDDDNTARVTYVYKYNKGGNRISVEWHEYTLNDSLGLPYRTELSAFLDPVWRDRMTSCDSLAIVYDSLGNPVLYKDNHYKWEGRQLNSISDLTGKTEYKYGPDGLRTQKLVYNSLGTLTQKVKYIWNDGRLDSVILTENDRTDSSKILYDSNDKPVGAIINGGRTVMFVKNIQGDILKLVDSNGDVFSSYSYDAWGRMSSVPTSGDAAKYLELCPFTYRGYMYDRSTDLYYLQSRYYNPKWGRFLNCDDTNILLATQGTDHGANLFVYCANDPVNRADYLGMDFTPIDLSDLGHFLILLFYSCFDDKIIIGSDKDESHERYHNSKKGYIKINIAESKTFDDGSCTLSDLIFEFYQARGDIAFDILASIATIKFKNDFVAIHNKAYPSDKYLEENTNDKIERDFLFSDECVSNEIKGHCLLKWETENKIQIKDTSVDTVILKVGSVGRTIKKEKLGILKDFSSKVDSTSLAACSVIDIFEQDAAKFTDRNTFSYFSGIRECYKKTEADPYWHKPIRVKNVRNEWKTKKIPII